MKTPARPFARLAAAVLLAAATPLCAVAQGDSTWQDHNRATAVAFRARDWPAFRYHLLRLDTLLRGLPRVQLRLASVEARLGRPEAALQRLERYAAMGLTADLDADSALAPLRGLPGWAPIAERIARNADPVRRADTVVVLPSRDMMAEDIAYDARSRRFFVSSMRERRILAVDRRGRVTDFVPSSQGGIWAAVDLGVDARRRLLWVTTDALTFQVGYDSADAGRAAIIAYDLDTGRQVRRIDAPRDTARFLGDLAVAPTGEVYVSDNNTRAVYVVRPGADSLEVLVPPGVLAMPQGPVLSPDGRRLFVADYLRGIAAVDLATRRVDWLPQPPDVASNGIDGLYVAGRSLIGVQNGTAPERIVRFPVDEGFTRILGWEVLEQNPQLDEPNHGVVVGDAFYFIANSGGERARGATVQDDPAARPPAVMRVRLR
jgi:sugar lactone lactonase YvrE